MISEQFASKQVELPRHSTFSYSKCVNGQYVPTGCRLGRPDMQQC